MLWYTNRISLGFIIIRDMTFYKSTSLDSQKEKIIVELNLGVNEQMELKIEAPRDQSRNSRVEQVQDLNVDYAPDQ